MAGQQTTAGVELYDPVTGEFSLAGNMDAPRYNHTATLLNDGRVLIAEGVSGSAGGNTQVQQDDVYDPVSGMFTPIGPTEELQNLTVMPFDSVLLANGQVLANDNTIFDPASNTLSDITPLAHATLQDYKFALLPNNQVFATSNNYTTYLFDPASETYTASASLQYLRSSPTLKLLPNGQVLVAGGAGVAQAEFYVPPVATSNSAPSLSGLSPSSAVAGGAGFTLLVVGSDFVNNSVVNFNGTARQTTFLNAGQLQIAVTAGDIAVPGNATITVANPPSGAGGGGTSNPLTLTILAANSQPVLGALLPASAIAGGASFTLGLSGNNFTANSVVTFGGMQVQSTFESATVLNATIPASAIAVAGTPLVTVLNPGSAPSVAISFTVNNPVPQESLLSPSSIVAGSAAITLNVSGTNFNASSSILVNGAAAPETFVVNATLLQTSLPASDLKAGGPLNISVNNPSPGGGTSPALTFTVYDYTVTAPASPATVNAGQPATFNLTVAPSNGAFSNPIAFTVSGVPAEATASFSPSATITPGANSQTVTLMITTAPHTAYTMILPVGDRLRLQLLWIPAMVLALTCVVLRTSRRRALRVAAFVRLALLLTLAAGLAACGGGGYASNSSPSPQLNPTTGTPAGTYPITITATSGEDSHSTTVTLTVM